MSDMSNSRRSKFANFFKDFITYLKAKLTHNKAITAEVLKLERLFNEALSAAEQKNTATEGEEKYSFAGEKAKTADKTLLESAKERIETGISLSKEITEYPYNMQTVIKDYLSSADKSLLNFVESVENSNRFARHKISNVSENQVSDVKRLLNIDVNGFTNDINSNAIKHIKKRHGKNGIADTSMSNILDIARIGYVLKNYDTVDIAKDGLDNVNSTEFRNSKNQPVPMLIFSKKINGTYYIAQAIPESQYKKLWVVSAYISKKEAGTQALNNKNNSQVGTSLASSASNNKIPQSDTVVKNNISENTKNYSENAQKEEKKYSIPDRQTELLKKYDNGEITREEYLEESNKNREEAVNTYGAFKEGENAKDKTPVPQAVREGKNTKRFTRTVIEKGNLTSGMKEEIGAELLEGGFEYTPISDEQAIRLFFKFCVKQINTILCKPLHLP